MVQCLLYNQAYFCIACSHTPLFAPTYSTPHARPGRRHHDLPHNCRYHHLTRYLFIDFCIPPRRCCSSFPSTPIHPPSNVTMCMIPPIHHSTLFFAYTHILIHISHTACILLSSSAYLHFLSVIVLTVSPTIQLLWHGSLSSVHYLSDWFIHLRFFILFSPVSSFWLLVSLVDTTMKGKITFGSTFYRLVASLPNALVLWKLCLPQACEIVEL